MQFESQSLIFQWDLSCWIKWNTSLKSWWSSSPAYSSRLEQLQAIKNPLQQDLPLRTQLMKNMQNFLAALQALVQEEIVEIDALKKEHTKLHYNSEQSLINLLAIVGCLNWIALRTRPDIAWATSRAASLITHAPDTCFIRVKHICQYLHRGEESTRTNCVSWYHLEPEERW